MTKQWPLLLQHLRASLCTPKCIVSSYILILPWAVYLVFAVLIIVIFFPSSNPLPRRMYLQYPHRLLNQSMKKKKKKRFPVRSRQLPGRSIPRLTAVYSSKNRNPPPASKGCRDFLGLLICAFHMSSASQMEQACLLVRLKQTHSWVKPWHLSTQSLVLADTRPVFLYCIIYILTVLTVCLQCAVCFPVLCICVLSLRCLCIYLLFCVCLYCVVCKTELSVYLHCIFFLSARSCVCIYAAVCIFCIVFSIRASLYVYTYLVYIPILISKYIQYFQYILSLLFVYLSCAVYIHALFSVYTHHVISVSVVRVPWWNSRNVIVNWFTLHYRQTTSLSSSFPQFIFPLPLPFTSVLPPFAQLPFLC